MIGLSMSEDRPARIGTPDRLLTCASSRGSHENTKATALKTRKTSHRHFFFFFFRVFVLSCFPVPAECRRTIGPRPLRSLRSHQGDKPEVLPPYRRTALPPSTQTLPPTHLYYPWRRPRRLPGNPCRSHTDEPYSGFSPRSRGCRPAARQRSGAGQGGFGPPGARARRHDEPPRDDGQRDGARHGGPRALAPLGAQPHRSAGRTAHRNSEGIRHEERRGDPEAPHGTGRGDREAARASGRGPEDDGRRAAEGDGAAEGRARGAP